MSMPSSRELVATTQRSRPDLRSSSIWARCSFDTDPWCARASNGTSETCVASFAAPVIPDPPIICAGNFSGATPVTISSWSSFMDAVSRSASRRELANTIVERCCSTCSTIARSTCGQIDPADCSPVSSGSPGPGLTGSVERTPSSVMSSTGTTTRRSNVFEAGGCTIVTGAIPPRKRATSSMGRTVAESPMRCAGFSSTASRRSSVTARCAPRFEAATAWISSTMTVSTPARVSRAAEVSMR